MVRSLIFTVLLAVASIVHAEIDEMGYDMVPVDPREYGAEQIEAGRTLYVDHCAGCHGVAGDGMGPMAEMLYPRPRDFTWGLYKIRHTISGEMPLDSDIYRAIESGMPGTSMPGWGGIFSDEEIWSLVGYLRTFCSDFEDFPAEVRLNIGDPIPYSEESVVRGRAVYVEMGCAKCHGDTGRGNGESAEVLKDDWAFRIWPADLTKAWRFRGGAGPVEIYRTLVTGMSGTPMPSYSSSTSSEDAWHLANFVASLSREPVYDIVVRGARVEEIASDPYDPMWEGAPAVDFRLAGQIIEEPRLYTAMHEIITVRALHDGHDVAIQLIWNDLKENVGDSLPPDKVAVQFAAEHEEGANPYFLLGDRRNPVDYWEWSAGDTELREFIARGTSDVEQKELQFTATGGYGDGEYRVILRRPMTTDGVSDVQFGPGQFIPVAFHLWDGMNGEEGMEMAVSAWYYLLLEPPTDSSVFVWPVIVGLVGVSAETLIVRRLRRRRQ